MVLFCVLIFKKLLPILKLLPSGTHGLKSCYLQTNIESITSHYFSLALHKIICKPKAKTFRKINLDNKLTKRKFLWWDPLKNSH